MHERFFLEHIYTEIFVISLNLGKHQRIEIHTELFDVMESLNPRSIDHSKDIKVVHGYLLPATILPNNFNGIDGFVIANLPDTNYGLFTGNALHNSETLAVAIQATIGYEKVDIKNIFVLYGTKMELTLSIAEDELDEELIERSQAIVRAVKQIEEKLEVNR